MKYRTKDLDIAMLLLPQDGSLGVCDQMTDKKKLVIYNYLKSKKLVTVNYNNDDTVLNAGLTDEGIEFIAKGGFISEEFNKNYEKQQKIDKQYWEGEQRKKVRRAVIWSALIGVLVGGFAALLVQYYFQIL